MAQIENLLQYLKILLLTNTLCTNLSKLDLFCKREWTNTSVTRCTEMVETYSERLAAVITRKPKPDNHWNRQKKQRYKWSVRLNSFLHLHFLFCSFQRKNYLLIDPSWLEVMELANMYCCLYSSYLCVWLCLVFLSQCSWAKSGTLSQISKWTGLVLPGLDPLPLGQCTIVPLKTCPLRGNVPSRWITLEMVRRDKWNVFWVWVF